MGLKEYVFGFDAENRATKFLKSQNFTILERNFHSKFGEIDIIAKKGEIYHFIEVKATLGDYETAYRVTKSKMEKIIKTIDFYMLKLGFYVEFQIDLICIEKDNVKFLENITF